MWLKDVCQMVIETYGTSLNSLVIVLDNAPCHAKAEIAVADLPGVEILRLGPYSPVLNPIENAWSSIKAHIKKREAESMDYLQQAYTNSGLSQAEFRMQFVEQLIDEARQLITPIMCLNYVNHVQAFFSDVLHMKDLPVGQ